MATVAELSHRQRRAIWWNAALWMAGHSLTSGAFLTYFASDLQASATLMALLLAAPELAGASGLVSERVWQWCGERRRAWLVTTVVARIVTLLVPFAGAPWLLSLGAGGPWFLLGLVIVSQFFQGIATALYFGWLSDLTPASGWGRLFGRRNNVVLLVQMTVPLAGALLRDHWRHTAAAGELWLAYAMVFASGTALLLLSVLPMLNVPDPFANRRESSHPPEAADLSRPDLAVSWRKRGSWRDRGMRRVLAHSWCLALANGLTQAAFFKYQIGVVRLSLTGYLLLFDLMLALQLVGSSVAGRCRSAPDHRRVLFVGTLIGACALPFWMLATREQWWWLVGAFACWGAFGAVNVAGPNLMLGFTRPGETTTALVLFRQIAGVLAGVSGILGGWLLDRLLTTINSGDAQSTSPFLILFAASLAGRILAAILVLRVPVDETGETGQV